MDRFHKSKTLRDPEYVKAYLETESQIKAAEMCGVSRETIARAVRRAGIQLNGRKHNGNNQSQSKISDKQLSSEVASGLNCSEIAHKYGMSPERVYRRARSIGLSINDSLSGGHWTRRATHYGCKAFDVSINLKTVITKYDGICQICGKPTDITDIVNGHIRKKYPTLDHIIPLSKGGTHTWDNIQLAHMECNSGKRDRLVSR